MPPVERSASVKVQSIAVLIPCFNEEAAIGAVVRDFRAALPAADVYVCDNNSTDRSATVAEEAGAVVCHEPLQGKGNALRRMFADLQAEIYVIVDGDGTYDATAAPRLVDYLATHHLDVVNAKRVGDSAAYRAGHRFGNRVLTGIVSRVFGKRFDDILSGYKVLSLRFVKSFPALSSGFEVETELAIHALDLDMPIAELPAPYRERAAGSNSKLRTMRDGLRILRTIGILVKEERPLPFFAICAALLATVAVILAWPICMTFIATGLVPRLPTAVLAAGLMLTSFLSLACGLILDTVTRGRRELKRLFYLSYPSP